MNTYPQFLFPDMALDATTIQYFWYMLPFAVPGFITFIVGVVLCVLGLLRLMQKERIGYYLSFSGTCLGFGMLGLVFALRSVIRDEATLLEWNTRLYPLVLIIVPSSYHFIYYILEKKYKILLWGAGVNWITTLVALIGIWKGLAFTGKFLNYNFGNFPIASLYLKQWGIIGSASYFLCLPVYFHYLRRNSLRDKLYLVIGHNLLSLFMISNLPSFVGISIFPGSTFSFIPMIILAYGVFNTDFRDMKELLFEKNGFFYVLNAFVGIILLACASSIVFIFSPSDYDQIHWYPWILIPLISIFFVVGLGIFIGGTNPNSPLNQWGAFSLYLFGFQLLAVIAVNLVTDPLIGRRVEQLCYMIFCIAPSVQMRFVFLSLNRPFPKVLPFIDMASILMCFMAMSPYLFTGYYKFPWGQFSASGPVILVFGMVGCISVIIVMREWLLCRKSKIQNRLMNFVALYVSVGGLMFLSDLPASIGIDFYPLGNLSILPTGILAFAVLRYGGDTVRTESLQLSSYLVPFASLSAFFIILYIGSTLPKEASNSTQSLHLLLSGVPLMLFSFLATFVLIRPIANRIDSTLHSLAQEREITVKQKNEIEDLNQFTYIVNSLSNLNDIFIEISKYVYEHFYIAGSWLFLPDEKEEYLKSFKAYSYEKIPEENYQYMQNLQVPLDEKEGMAYIVWKRQKPFYISHISKFKFSIDQEIAKKTKAVSFLYIPLVLKNKSVGIIVFSNLINPMNLHKSDIRTINSYCAQIAGVVRNADLLKQTTDAQLESEKAKHEIEKLNSVTKRINSVSSLTDIMTFIMFHLEKEYKFKDFWLLLKDEYSDHLYTFSFTSPRISDETYKTFMNFKVSLNEESFLCRTYREQKILYKPLEEINNLSPIDKLIIESGNFTFLLQIPFVIYEETIGILCLHNKSIEIISNTLLEKLITFSNQVAGAVSNSKLFKQAQEAREAADEAKLKAEKQKEETEGLNQLIKSLNEKLDLHVIMIKVQKYVKDIFGIDYYSLYSVTEDKQRVKLLDAKFPEYVNEIDKNFIRNFEIPIAGTGAHGVTFKAKRPFFPSRIRRNSVTDQELFVIDKCKIVSFLMIPLILQNEPIGILDFFNEGKMNLSKDDISRLSILGEQLAGIIYGSNLYQQVQEEKEKAVLAQREIEKLAESRKRLSMIGEMASGIVHDIKNPMATIKAFAEMVNDPDLDSESRVEYTNLILREIERLSDMTFEILDFSKGKLNLNLEFYNGHEFLNEIYNFLKLDFEYANIKLLIECNYSGMIQIDKERLRRVLVNMANNAREAMNDSKREYSLKISLIEENNYFQFLLADNGPGIPSHVEERIFEAFATEGKKKGTGLGLYMSKWIVEQHNGKIEYTTTRDQGTTFTISIPKTQEG
jgi:signal transduction histidine kinase